MKLLAWVLSGVLVVFLVAGAVVFLGLGYYLSPQDKLTKSDAIVAISGGETAARAEEAIRLYKDGWASHLIFSGAAQDPGSPSNASAMAAEAKAAGVPSAAIALDETSADTRQNAANVNNIVEAKGYRSIILVTSPYHQRRASILFHRALPKQVAVINRSAPDQTWSRSRWWATAASRALTKDEIQKVLYELFQGGRA
jgi:uncharacterized SAM-binding protein YcdF (DUF218 family)